MTEDMPHMSAVPAPRRAAETSRRYAGRRPVSSRTVDALTALSCFGLGVRWAGPPHGPGLGPGVRGAP